MRRLFDMLLVATVFGGAVWTYQIKHASEQSARRIAVLQKEIDAQRNKITLLRADWAILTAPERLQRVSEAFAAELGIQKMAPSQIITRAELPPMRPVSDPLRELMADTQDGDETMTGSVAVPTSRPTGAGE